MTKLIIVSETYYNEGTKKHETYKPTYFDTLNKDIKTKSQFNDKGLEVVRTMYKKDSSFVRTKYFKYLTNKNPFAITTKGFPFL